MMKIYSNPFITWAHEVGNNNLLTSYYNDHSGNIYSFFFFTTKQNNRTIPVAHAYEKYR